MSSANNNISTYFVEVEDLFKFSYENKSTLLALLLTSVILAISIFIFWDRQIQGVLQKLEGHRGDSPIKGFTTRWRAKWVTCDGVTLSYYSYSNKVQKQVEMPPGSPKAPQSPLGSKQRSLSIEEENVPRKQRCISSSEIETKPDALLIHLSDGDYDITFKCEDIKDFEKWSRYLKSVAGGSLYSWYNKAIKSIFFRIVAFALVALIFIGSIFDTPLSKWWRSL